MRINSVLTTPSACGRHPFRFFPKTLRFLTAFGMTKGNFSRFSSLTVLRSYGLMVFLLCVFAITNAQVSENEILDADTVQFVPKNELKMTPEITKMLIDKLYSSFIDSPDWELANFGIKNRAQLEHLHLGKPIPEYVLDNENLRFINIWKILVMSDDEPLHFVEVRLKNDGQYIWAGTGSAGFAPLFHNYKHKNLIIGFVDAYPESYLMIRKDNIDVFVKIYDYETREYLKREYSLSDIVTMYKEY